MRISNLTSMMKRSRIDGVATSAQWEFKLFLSKVRPTSCSWDWGHSVLKLPRILCSVDANNSQFGIARKCNGLISVDNFSLKKGT